MSVSFSRAFRLTTMRKKIIDHRSRLVNRFKSRRSSHSLFSTHSSFAHTVGAHLIVKLADEFVNLSMNFWYNNSIHHCKLLSLCFLHSLMVTWLMMTYPPLTIMPVYLISSIAVMMMARVDNLADSNLRCEQHHIVLSPVWCIRLAGLSLIIDMTNWYLFSFKAKYAIQHVSC